MWKWEHNIKDETDQWLFQEWINWKWQEQKRPFNAKEVQSKIIAVMVNLDMWNEDRMHDILQ